MRPVAALLVALLALLAAPADAVADERVVALAVLYRSGDVAGLDVPAGEQAAVVRRLRADPSVEVVEPDSVVSAADVVPNDPLFLQQWGLGRVGAPRAWDRTTGDQRVLLAVVDSGVDPSHPDLAGASVAGFDFVDGDQDTSDPNGHGTSVAGIAAARTANAAGMAGACWQCRILPIRVLDSLGNGRSSDVAAGIRYAVDRGARVVNLSLSGPGNSSAVQSAVAYARSKGAVVVAAAGNQEASTDVLTAPQYPAAVPGVVGVVATNTLDAPYSWSYRGPWTDIAAPGCNLSTRAAAKGGGYASSFCGTSSASPMVAGVIGLAFSAFPAATGPAVEAALAGSGVPVGSDVAPGGRLDAAAFLDAVAVSAATEAAEKVQRVGGSDPVSTAVAVSTATRTTAPAAVLARADDFADALAAGPLAGKVAGPLLLTAAGSLDPRVASELTRLGVTDVHLAGGTAALGPEIEATLRANGITSVRRWAGADRFETAATIAGFVGGATAYLASGSSYADAISVSGLASRLGRPILLTARDAVPAATLAALTGRTTVVGVGGTEVVAEGVLDVLRGRGLGVSRVAGADRYATSAAVADASVGEGIAVSRTWLATGRDWRDALVAGAAAAGLPGVLLLVNPDQVSGSASGTWLSANWPAIQKVVVVGSEEQVPAVALAQIGSLG